MVGYFAVWWRETDLYHAGDGPVDVANPAATEVAETADGDQIDEAEEGSGPRVLSKKEKEKLKKEREKVSPPLVHLALVFTSASP